MPNATSDSFQKETQRVAWPHREIWMQGNEQGTACHFPHEHSLGKAFIHNHLLLLHLDTFLKVWERFCEGSWPSRQTDSHQGAKFTLQANPDFHELPHYKSRCSHAQEMMNVPQAGPPSWHLSEGSSPCSARWLPAWQYLCTLILQLK